MDIIIIILCSLMIKKLRLIMTPWGRRRPSWHLATVVQSNYKSTFTKREQSTSSNFGFIVRSWTQSQPVARSDKAVVNFDISANLASLEMLILYKRTTLYVLIVLNIGIAAFAEGKTSHHWILTEILRSIDSFLNLFNEGGVIENVMFL